jgi:hypothetical protein
MAKQKISSKDFLNLLDDQESSKEKAAFKPKPAVEKKLGPVQKELLDLVLSKTPPSVAKWATTLVGRMRRS